MLPEAKLSDALDFFVVLGTSLGEVRSAVEDAVLLGLSTPLEVEFSFWKSIAPKSGVAEVDVVLTVLDGSSETVWLALLLVEGAALDFGAGVVLEGAADDEEGGAALEATAAAASDPALEPPFGNTTTLALPPAGMVTTQNEAPPAPTAWSALVTPPIPTTDGSMEHGVPSQPSPSHTIETPKLGITLLKEDDV
jgi:hypothetical protein